MAIVLGGLGQPERGSLAAFGLGAAESDPNAMQAALGGSCSIAATLTDGTTPEPPPITATGGGRYHTQAPRAPRPAPKLVDSIAVPAYVVAHLSGTSTLTASLDYEIDGDLLANELVFALLLDLV